ncbi:MAG: hypothetical protein A3K19_29320 [Lentisphaerae bacterium RIFOXYB12_FULL_65_16]|nr:MAG: hypothetical protein A3K18_13325 [Lentisphaerae bacterium RIFOXYA12_64_32]OGV88399.1 MAG: hypothetical protein A3K19_29320 [Lentisphaerae bacterium RIFOXYB12_FULL_65_16]
MKKALLMVAGVMTVGGASWLALAAAENENPPAPAAVAPGQCHVTAAACPQAAGCRPGPSDCNAGCKNCPAAKDQDGDGRYDAAKDCVRHSGSCATAHRTGACQTDAVLCRGANRGDSKDFKDADGNGACAKIADCGRHSGSACPGHGKRGSCHATTQPPEAAK